MGGAYFDWWKQMNIASFSLEKRKHLTSDLTSLSNPPQRSSQHNAICHAIKYICREKQNWKKKKPTGVKLYHLIFAIITSLDFFTGFFFGRLNASSRKDIRLNGETRKISWKKEKPTPGQIWEWCQKFSLILAPPPPFSYASFFLDGWERNSNMSSREAL